MLSKEGVRQIEESFKNDLEAHELLALIDAEFQSDPLSVQCFDLRIVQRVRACVEGRRIFRPSLERGGTTPHNMLPFANSDSTSAGASQGHGAATPLPLARWLVNYLTPIGGTVLDPFAGSGTIGLACLNLSRNYIGLERDETHAKSAQAMLARAMSGQPIREPEFSVDRPLFEMLDL